MALGSMPNSVLPLQVDLGGPPKQVNVLVFRGPGGRELDQDAELLVFSPDPSTAGISLHPTKPRAIVVTPGHLPGTVHVTVSSSPVADEDLEIVVTNVEPPPLRKIVPDPENPPGPVEA